MPGTRAVGRALERAIPVAGLWLSLATVLTAITYRIADWWKVPDEMVFQRLALSIARDHSLVPRIHGEAIRSLNQLYPLLIAPIVGGGYVADDLPQLRVLNAVVFTSACIPAYLLGRSVTGRVWAGLLLGGLSVCIPWAVLAGFVLTEVAALPAFLWAALAIHRALVRPSAARDALALAGIALAFLARTQLVFLLVVLPLAVVATEIPRAADLAWRDRVRRTARRVVGRHRLLAAVYGALAVVGLVVTATGGHLLSLSIYGDQFGRSYPLSTVPGWTAAHVADLAFVTCLLPLLVGVAWALANLVRPAASVELQAFACLTSIAFVVGAVEVTIFDLELGGFLFDRYLLYVVPLVLLAFVCALLDPRPPRWSLALPAAVVAAGFLLHFQQGFTWDGDRVNSDSPPAVLYRPFVDLFGGRGGAALAAAVLTLALAAAFALLARRARGRRVAVALLALLALALPAETGYVFYRLFNDGAYFERPLTRSNAGLLDWVDRTVGTDAAVTIAPYPVSSAFLVTQNYWRDLEFWNKSVAGHVVYPAQGVFSFTGPWFPKQLLGIGRDGAVTGVRTTPYLVQSVGDTRFRVAGEAVRQTPEAALIRADQPWRLAWRSEGLYDDGWTRPGTLARVVVYPDPGQPGPVVRYLSFQLRGAEGAPPARVTIRSGIERRSVDVPAEPTTDVHAVKVCVPPNGAATVELEAAGTAEIPGGQLSIDDSQQARQGRVDVASISLADETGGPCRLSR